MNVNFFVCDEHTLSMFERSLLGRLRREYTVDVAEHVLIPLLSHTSPVSLRVLDWAVVNWAKQHHVVCSAMSPGKMTHVHQAYRAHLAYWKRTLFDPFRRRKRIQLRVGGEGAVVHETTLGQANFALFAYTSGVYAYVLGHLDDIEADMNLVTQRTKRLRASNARGERRVRGELTRPSKSACVVYIAPTTMVFHA